MHSAPKQLLEDLDAEQIQYTVLPHQRTVTATAEAHALGVDPAEVAKTLVLTTPSGFVRAVIPASKRLDLHKVSTLLETDEIALATEAELAGAYPEYELGAVPPLVGHRGDRVIIDLRLAATDSVLVEAGTHEASLRIRAADLIAQPDATTGDLCLQ
jgi:Ala-tRNA(Pro) deacylase